jgi:hypothetical protein
MTSKFVAEELLVNDTFSLLDDVVEEETNEEVSEKSSSYDDIISRFS